MTSHLHIVRPKTKADEAARLRSRSEAKVERGLRRYARAYYFRESLRTKFPWLLLFILLIGAIMSLSLCVFAGDIRTAVGLLYGFPKIAALVSIMTVIISGIAGVLWLLSTWFKACTFASEAILGAKCCQDIVEYYEFDVLGNGPFCRWH